MKCMKREAWRSYASHEWLNEFIKRLDMFYKQSLVCERKLKELEIAAEEIFVNVVQYAYPDQLYCDNDKIIYISMKWEEDERIAQVCLSDRGIPYNPLSKRKPELSPDIRMRPIGGLGIYLARKLTDDIQYFRKNNENNLILTKKLDKE